MENNSVNLTISKDIVNPIVEAKIKEAIIAAMGGKEEIIAEVVNKIITQKVNDNGNVSSYSSDNKYTWLDIVITRRINELVKAELANHITDAATIIKDTLIQQIKTKKGASMVAQALLSGMQKSFENTWSSKMSIEFNPKKDD